MEVPQSGYGIASLLRHSPSPPHGDDSRPLSPIPEVSAAAPGSTPPRQEEGNLRAGETGSAKAATTTTLAPPQLATTEVSSAPPPKQKSASAPVPTPAPATTAKVTAAAPSPSASSESSKAQRESTKAAPKGKSVATTSTSQQQPKGKKAPDATRAAPIEAGQRTLASMLSKKTPPSKDAPAEPADVQLVLHTNPALAQVERREAHAKGLVAPHMLSGERYPPTLIEFINN